MDEIIKREETAPAAAAALSFPELFRRFLASPFKCESTKLTYARALKQFGIWTDANAPAGPLKSESIWEFKRALVARGLSPLTVNSYLAAVKKFFSWTEGAGIYPNIARGIEPEGRERDVFYKDNLTLDQARGLLKAVKVRTVKGKRDFAIINLMIQTGLRTIEIRRANVGDMVNQGNATVLHVQGKGKKDKAKYVVLTPATLAPIHSYLKTRGAVRPDDPLFAAISNRNLNGRMTTKSISRLIKAAIEKIAPGNPRLTAHSLRHTAVTFALLGGASVQETQAFARHADINTTLIYAHNIERIAAVPEKAIAAFLKG